MLVDLNQDLSFPYVNGEYLKSVKITTPNFLPKRFQVAVFCCQAQPFLAGTFHGFHGKGFRELSTKTYKHIFMPQCKGRDRFLKITKTGRKRDSPWAKALC